MQRFLTCICCCIQTNKTAPLQSNNPQIQIKKKKVNATPKPSRLKTKYIKSDFQMVAEESRRQKKIKSYCCPICTLYYTHILACSDCVNMICLNCYEAYDKKNLLNKQKLKCPFCSSIKSIFCDYQLDPHSYFDTSKNGFLPKEEKIKVVEEKNQVIDYQNKPSQSGQIIYVQQNERAQ